MLASLLRTKVCLLVPIFIHYASDKWNDKVINFWKNRSKSQTWTSCNTVYREL